jgi:hypothetical protein
MLHGKPPVSARYMIEPRCLIMGHGSTGSFPGDFAELGKWFRQPSAGVGVPRSFAVRQHRGNAHSITKTERCRSANLLQMTRGLMCKLRQRAQGYGGRRPAGSRRIDPSLQPPPAVTARFRGECQKPSFSPQKRQQMGEEPSRAGLAHFSERDFLCALHRPILPRVGRSLN